MVGAWSEWLAQEKVPGIVCHIECHSVLSAVNGGHDLDRHADKRWPLIDAAADYERIRLV
ncbi:MAG: hypothetical protein QOJ31_1776, partial [Gaiellales bacterium]|nr:hypothetical protein [Gaiellales bacterium]